MLKQVYRYLQYFYMNFIYISFYIEFYECALFFKLNIQHLKQISCSCMLLTKLTYKPFLLTWMRYKLT